MSYPNISITVKDNKYSVSFPIDRRRNTIDSVLDYINNGLYDKNVKLISQENNKIWNIDSKRYNFSDGNSDFTITLQGPNNEYFYTFEYSKPTDFQEDA